MEECLEEGGEIGVEGSGDHLLKRRKSPRKSGKVMLEKEDEEEQEEEEVWEITMTTTNRDGMREMTTEEVELAEVAKRVRDKP